MEAPCDYLEWDSRFFGVEVARVTVGRPDAGQLAAVERWCEPRGIDCVYLLLDDALAAAANAAEDAGFRLVDVRVTLARPVTPSVAPAASPISSAVAPAIALRAATEGDIPALRAIARSSHRDSRFYRDGGFATARCDALYETWIEKSCRDPAAAVWLADTGGAVCGYVTCERPSDGTGRIGLFAVDPRTRGRGIGAALVARAMEWFEEQGLGVVHVTTQGANVGAQRLYQACGFRTESVQLWLHRWRRQQGRA